MVGLTISSICINGENVPINNRDDLRMIQGVIEAFLKFGSAPSPASVPPPITTTNSHRAGFPANAFRPEGERSIDYARRAAAMLGNEFTLRQLADKMATLGWQTKADSERSRSNTVRATIRDKKDFRNFANGFWSYVGSAVPVKTLLDEDNEQ